MNLIKILKAISKSAVDPKRGMSERVFISLTLISEIAALFALFGDLLIFENRTETVAILVTVVLIPVITYLSVRYNKIKLAARLIIFSLVFILLPILFFFGGGAGGGGGVYWFIFAFLYSGLVLTGSFRIVILLLIGILAGVCFLVEYFHSEFIHIHTRGVGFVDSYLGVMLVGVLCFAMTWFQNRLFEEERERARKAVERAEELTRSQNRFFSSMSHEIRTPINSILGLNELILRDTSASDNVIKDANGIQGAGKMLLALINDILDFSKMEAGSMDIVPVNYRIGDMISDIVNMIWLRADEKGLKFEVNIDPKIPTVLYGDEVRIKQVIVNILNNAVKYTKSGSVELHIEGEPVDDDSIILSISVSDTGMGIKKEALPFLFDAFKRVDEEKNRHIEGTGLGLSIVKQLVELMDGNITVNSVYGEGSVFTVSLKQGISERTEIGELNIHNQKNVSRKVYEPGFKAHDVDVLIVDDNEMNLEVESRLLADTGIVTDKSISGYDALDRCLKKHYDVIFMDHLMPGIDGIDCLKSIREQAGGMNRQTPVIVLTANAGSENRDLYNRSGFDGYLLKPVSGEALENILIKHISPEKIVLSAKAVAMREDINTVSGYSGKQSVIITTSSLSDVPDSIVKKNNLHIIPAFVKTEEGVFKDGVQLTADEIIRYMETGKMASSSAADENSYTEFFAGVIKKAHHVIHIALTTSLSSDYLMASEAAKAFENVTVINSETLSSATALLVLIALKLSRQNIPVEDIITELENVKHRLRCSFVIDTTEFMARKGHISQRVNRLAKGLALHPFLTFKEDKSNIGGFAFGSTKRAYKKYIRKAIPVDIIPDPEVCYITYVDIPMDTLLWIRDELSKVAYFEHVVFQQASAAISSNCGPGTLGLLYFVKSNKTYNIGSFIDETSDIDEDEDVSDHGDVYGYSSRAQEGALREKEDRISVPERHFAGVYPVREGSYETEKKWYEKLENIDASAAIKNSGSEDAFRTVLKIFYDSIPEKSSEIGKLFDDENWGDYTIKVHALKSSAKLIGALDLSDKAQLLENAGKEKNTDYIKNNHPSFMDDYKMFSEILAPVFSEDHSGDDSIMSERPVADESLMKTVFEGLKEAADNMDCDALEDIFREMEEYTIPDTYREKYETIKKKAGDYDYEGILGLFES